PRRALMEPEAGDRGPAFRSLHSRCGEMKLRKRKSTLCVNTQAKRSRRRGEFLLPAVLLVHVVLLYPNPHQHHGDHPHRDCPFLLSSGRLKVQEQHQVPAPGCICLPRPPHSPHPMGAAALQTFLPRTEKAPSDPASFFTRGVSLAVVLSITSY
uniref:Uncharacterized protein n=1 Tax=Peromyscus maniculatus bairdii TaxID=230844 RepID=A0A8C8W0T1_PERMB